MKTIYVVVCHVGNEVEIEKAFISRLKAEYYIAKENLKRGCEPTELYYVETNLDETLAPVER